MTITRLDLERRYTAEEFERLPEFQAQRYELIDGRLVVKPMPGYEHSWIADLIRIAVYEYDPKRKLGSMVQEASTRLTPQSVRQPDLSFWVKARAPHPRTKGAATRPDLAVEIWSPSDVEDPSSLATARAKVQSYLVAGVRLVWAVNPANQTVEVYHSGQPAVQTLGLEDTLSGEDLIPGFELPVTNLFSIADDPE